MYMYRLLVLIEIAIGMFTAVGINMLIERDLVKPGFAIPAGVVAFVVLLIVLPGRASIARRYLRRGVCPQCRGELRQYEHEELKYYCPPCQVGYTIEGRRAPRGADPS